MIFPLLVSNCLKGYCHGMLDNVQFGGIKYPRAAPTLLAKDGYYCKNRYISIHKCLKIP